MNAKHLTRKELSALVTQYPSNFSDTNRSPLTTHHSPKRTLAFTLAEVLITLGIIGIVAALTIPTIVSVFKKKEVETRLAQTYSILSQALKRAEVDYGDSQYWTRNLAGYPNTSDFKIVDKFLQTYLIPYLSPNPKIEVIDGYGLKKYGYNIRYFDGYQMLNMRMIRLDSGTNLFWGMLIGRQGVISLHIIVDINAAKAPNSIGRDLFDMTYSLYDGKLFMNGEKSIDGYGLAYSKKLNYSQLMTNCKNSATPDYYSPNHNCGAVIKLNGWKIPKDYPIKL